MKLSLARNREDTKASQTIVDNARESLEGDTSECPDVDEVAVTNDRPEPVDDAVVVAEEADHAAVSPFRDIPPTYAGHVKLLRWAHTSASGMTTTFKLADVDEDDQHPFKGHRAARASKTEGQRMMIAVTHPAAIGDTPGEPVYTGEALLVWWAEDCAEGMKVSIKLDETVDGSNHQHPCDGMDHGKRNGEILMLVAWAIDDQEQPEAPRARKGRKSFSELTPTAQSHILCRDDRFFQWLVKEENYLIGDPAVLVDLHPMKENDRQSYCEHVIKVFCGIGSRAEFSKDTEQAHAACQRWNNLVGQFEESRWGGR